MDVLRCQSAAVRLNVGSGDLDVNAQGREILAQLVDHDGVLVAILV